MNPEMKKKQKKSMLKDIAFFLIVLIIAALLLYLFPEKKNAVYKASEKFLIDMLEVLPAVMLLIGLFAVFVPNEIVGKYIGKNSGIKGIFISLLMGSLPTGPLYVAFPMASALLKKGAKVSNIIIFLSAWACIKIPQELVELQFLGAKFMASRLLLTVIFVIIMGLFVEKVAEP